MISDLRALLLRLSFNQGTGSIYSVACRSLGKKVTVIDTPGFGTCCKSDTELLEYIARFLGGLHKERKLLTGIVLLQPVYTDRIWEHEAKLVHLIKSICGPQAYRNIIIATSTPYSHPDGQTAQDQIRSREQNLWRDMINGGAEIWEYNNSRQSAENIVEELVDDRRAVLLQLQHELEMSEGRLLGTTAAREAHHVSLALYLSEQQRLYAEICHLRHQLSTAPHDRVYLQRRCADLEYERSSKTFQEQEVQRKKVSLARDMTLTVTTADRY